TLKGEAQRRGNAGTEAQSRRARFEPPAATPPAGTGVHSIRRTAGYGPVCPVVWAWRCRETPPIPIPSRGLVLGFGRGLSFPRRTPCGSGFLTGQGWRADLYDARALALFDRRGRLGGRRPQLGRGLGRWRRRRGDLGFRHIIRRGEI